MAVIALWRVSSLTSADDPVSTPNPAAALQDPSDAQGPDAQDLDAQQDPDDTENTRNPDDAQDLEVQQDPNDTQNTRNPDDAQDPDSQQEPNDTQDLDTQQDPTDGQDPEAAQDPNDTQNTDAQQDPDAQDPGAQQNADNPQDPDNAEDPDAQQDPDTEDPDAQQDPDEMSDGGQVSEDGSVDTPGAGAPATWTVEYTADGQFVPERLDITTGDEVVFLNASDQPVWPASNIHPTHEILPSFDPLEVIWPGDSWSYQFNENGYWRYHNHIEPSQTGLIVSLGGPEDDLEPLIAQFSDLDLPDPPATADGVALMNDSALLEQFVRDYGPAATVALLKQAELATGRDCHNAAHEAGRVAYEAFGPAAFVLSGHECQAGSMHGATEALFADRGTARLAEDVNAVCSSAPNPFVLHQCLHGIGHGLMAWTTYEIHEALELCNVIGNTSGRGSCYSGVFMENVVGGLSGLMGHQTEYLSADDPHFPCDVIAPRYAPDCYFYQTSHMLYVFGGDHASVAGECDRLTGRSRTLCFGSYGRDVGAATRGDPAGAVRLCNHAPAGADRVQCISGAVQDRFWEPTGAAEALQMCTLLETPDTTAEADTCWNTIITRARDVLTTPEARQAFCDAMPPNRKVSCVTTVD